VKGTNLNDAQSLRVNGAGIQAVRWCSGNRPKKIQLPFVNGEFVFAASVADVTVGEVRGNARVETAPARWSWARSSAQCNVTSSAARSTSATSWARSSPHTGAGDIHRPRRAHGRQVTTDGGLVRVIYAGGPMTLRSGGGDIIVRQFSALMDAETFVRRRLTLTADPPRKPSR